jgi:hypothetical protein
MKALLNDLEHQTRQALTPPADRQEKKRSARATTHQAREWRIYAFLV